MMKENIEEKTSYEVNAKRKANQRSYNCVDRCLLWAMWQTVDIVIVKLYLRSCY